MRPIAWFFFLLCPIACVESTTSSPMGDAPDDTAPHLDGGSVADGSPPDALIEDAAPTPEGGLRLLTVNLRNPVVEGDSGEERLAIVAALVVAEQPDFVALQEIAQRPGGTPTIDALVELTSYHSYWEITHRVPLSFEEGIGILSRDPIEAMTHHVLPHDELSGLLTRAMIGVTAGPVRFYATHLGALVGDAERADQAVEIADQIAMLSSVAPTFLLGDMNAEPDDMAMDILRGEVPDRSALRFVDAWQTTRPEDAGFTVPAEAPTRRIDYIYALEDPRVTPVHCETVFDDTVNGEFPSDHLGVMCTFDLALD